MADISSRISQATAQAEQLKSQIRANKVAACNKQLADEMNDLPNMTKVSLSCKRTLKGHQGKIYSMHWAADKPELVSAGQDGVLIVWDGLSANKTHAIPLRCPWVMSTCISPSGTYVASGGLDNIVSVFNLSSDEFPLPPVRELEGHNAQLTGMRFVNDKQLLSSAGDRKVIFWDVEGDKIITEFEEHRNDVSSISLSPDMNSFVSGSVDRTSKLFDIRAGRISQITFDAHDGDVNCVQFHPSGYAFAAGEERNVARLFDIRAGVCLSQYRVGNNNFEAGVTSICFTRSGRCMLASYEDDGQTKRGGGILRCWDALKGNQVNDIKAHKDQWISSVGLSGDGMAICTASWDTFLKIWA